MKDEKLIGAILYGQVEIIATIPDAGPLACHSKCNAPYCQCGECRLGIEEYEIVACPFCGSSISTNTDNPRCRHEISTAYVCGTRVNICSHYNGSPGSITTVIIGNGCCGMNDGEDII